MTNGESARTWQYWVLYTVMNLINDDNQLYQLYVLGEVTNVTTWMLQWVCVPDLKVF